MTTIIERHLPLLQKAQSLIGFGCWEWNTSQPDMLWTEGMFLIFNLPVTPDDHIAIETIDKMIHPEDLRMVKERWDEMKAGKPSDFQCRINIRLTDEIKYLHFTSTTQQDKKAGTIVQGCCRDVSKEKDALAVVLETKDEAELQLRTFQRAEQVARSGTWRIDLNTHETYYSDNLFRLYGLAPQSLPSHLNTFAPYVHPEERAVVLEMSDLAFRNKVPLHLEHRIKKADGEERYIRVISDIVRGLTGEEILTGITQDITEQKQLEMELKSTNEQLSIQNKHFRYTEQIGMIGTWQVDLATRETWYSDNLYRIYGLKPQQVQMGADQFFPFIFNEDKLLISEVADKTFNGEKVDDIEFRITRADGKMRYLKQSMQRVSSADHGDMMIGLVHDITEQKLLEKKLQQLNKELSIHNEAYEQAEQTANIGTWRWNLTTNDIFYSDNIYRIYGLKPQSVKPGFESFHRFFHPDDLERLREIPKTMLMEKQPVNMDYRIYRADGELRHLRTRNKMIITPAGEEILIGTTQDVTEEVVMRNKLDENIRFTRMLSNNLVDQLMVTNTSNTIVEFNKAAEIIQNVSRQDVMGRNFFEVFPQSRVPLIIDNFNRALNGEIVHDRSITSPLNKGIIDRYHIPVRDEEDKVIGVLTVVRDVTAEYRLRNELQQRLNFSENLLDTSVSRVTALDRELNYTVWNKRAETYYGLSKEKVIGKNVLEFNPSFKKDPLYDEWKKALTGETVYISPNENTTDGYHEAYFIPLKDDKEQVTGVLWIINDLTERREAEKAVEESRNLLQQTAEATPDAITIYDLQNSEPLYLNNQLADWIGVSVDTLTNMGVEGRLQLIHPDDKKALLEFNQKLKEASDNEIRTIEYRIHTKQRVYMWVRNRSKVFKRDNDTSVTHVLTVLQDITEQKITEEQIREKSHHLQRIQETVPDMISITELATMRFDYLNKDTFALHGFDPDKLNERTREEAAELVHNDDRPALAGYFSALKSASDQDVVTAEYRAKDFNDEWKWFLVRGRVFQRDAAGTVTHVLNVIENITERKLSAQQVIELKDKMAQKITNSVQSK